MWRTKLWGWDFMSFFGVDGCLFMSVALSLLVGNPRDLDDLLVIVVLVDFGRFFVDVISFIQLHTTPSARYTPYNQRRCAKRKMDVGVKADGDKDVDSELSQE